MPDEQPASELPATPSDAPGARAPLDQQDGWPQETEELPARPRRRVLTPLPLALLAALAIACGFIAGVLVEKGQGGSDSAAGGAGGVSASRSAALRGGAGSAASGSSATSGSSSGSRSATAGAPSGGLGLAGAGGPNAVGGAAAAGQVAYATKGTLYVTTSEGNTVKVTAAPGAGVTKTVETSIEAIHPGETVIVAGSSAANGAISARSIRIGSSASASSGSTTSRTSEPQLFGKG
jgi:hypothetical protein